MKIKLPAFPDRDVELFDNPVLQPEHPNVLAALHVIHFTVNIVHCHMVLSERIFDLLVIARHCVRCRRAHCRHSDEHQQNFPVHAAHKQRIDHQSQNAFQQFGILAEKSLHPQVVRPYTIRCSLL